MGSGTSKEAKVVTNVDVELTTEEKQRVVGELRQQIVVELRQQLQREHQQQLIPASTQTEDEYFNNITSLYEQEDFKPEDDSDYKSDSDDEEPVQVLNEDIDYKLLSKIVLHKYEGVDTEDEDETDSAYSQSNPTETIDDVVEEENVSAGVPQFQPNFAEFPSHKTLRQDNIKYWLWRDKYSISTTDLDAPIPPRQSKIDMFDLSSFAALDKYAIEAPRKLLNEPLKEVVQYLIKDCSTELQKTRVLFRWCVAQNLSHLPDNAVDSTVLQILKNIHNDRATYGKLYNDMLSIANVENKLLHGAVKAATYELGGKVNYEKTGNEWSVVRIDNVWRLVDLHFAARKLTGGSHGEWELIDDNGKGYSKVDDAPVGLSYSINEFYFLTDPEEFVYNHYPNDTEWQLLSRPVSKDEFKDMAYLRPSFFDLDMDVRAARRCVLHAQSGEVVMKIGLPQYKQRKFMYQIWKSSKDGVTADSIKDKRLSQFVFMEQRGGNLICKVTFPLTGKYKFRLFGHDSNDDAESSNGYSCVSDYLIYCTKEKEDFIALPRNSRQEWGPGYDLTKFGMHPISHTEGVIETDDGHVEVKFTTQQPVKLLVKVRGQNEEEINQWAIHREENGEATINLRIQEKGTYALDIFAKLQNIDGSFSYVCTYLVSAADGVTDRLKFPSAANQRAGAANDSTLYNLVPVTHKESYFTSDDGQENIIFDYSVPLEFICKMLLQSVDAETEIKEHIFIQQIQNRVTFKTRFPKAGIYLINIFARPKGSQASYTYVYNYIVYVPRPADGCLPFPQTYALWGEGCEIEGLEDGIVETGEEIEVKAKIPGAKNVAVIGGNDWTYLEALDGVWKAKVNVGDAGKSLQLAASFEESCSSYSTLAKYQIKTKEQLAVIKKEQSEAIRKEEDIKNKEEIMKKKREDEFKKIKKALEEAINSKNINKLRRAVKMVESNSYKIRLKEDYNTAKNLINSLERIAKLQKTILKMNQATMAEIRSYPQPPMAVHQVMIATLLLLKENESITKDWKKCQALGNTNILKKKVQKFKVHELHPEIASRSKYILQKFRLEDVSEISLGAACLYAWTVGMSEELNILKKNSVKKAKPADVKRQKEIFSGRLSVNKC